MDNPPPHSEQTVTFHDGEPSRNVELFQPAVDHSSTHKTRAENRDHSIEDVLGRPILVKSGVWAVTDPRGSVLYTCDFPGTLFAASPNAKAKASGFLNMTATICIKIVLNSQKFQQGRARLSFAPTAAVPRKAQMETNLMTFTQRPGTDIDLSSDTDVTMRVPYISEYLGVNFAKGHGGMGYFDFWVYSPLVSPTGSTNVGYSVYLWLEDVDLEYPTYIAQAGEPHEPAVAGPLSSGAQRDIFSSSPVASIPPCNSGLEKMFPFHPETPPYIRTYTGQILVHKAYERIPGTQSGVRKRELDMSERTLRARKVFINKILQILNIAPHETLIECLEWCRENCYAPVYEAEAGPFKVAKNTDPSVGEAKNPGTGLNGSSSPVIKTIMSSIPSLASVAGVPPWAQAIVKGVAQSFGFSKPIADHMLAKVNNSPFPHLNHADGASYAINMGFFHKNAVQHMPGFAGQDVDELAFAYICCIPAFYTNYAWNTGLTANSVIASIPLSPRTFRTTVSDWTYHTPMSYVGNCFEYWRTSFMFHVKVVKTSFHSGRLKVAWQPGAVAGDPIPDFNYLYQEVFDLRDGTEFTFNVPFVATTPYLSWDEVMGLIHIVVQNPLVCPATVASSVDLLVEVCAGKDVEFAFPRKPTETPISYNSVQMQGLQAKFAPQEEIFEAKLAEDEEEPIYDAEAGEWGEVTTANFTKELSDSISAIYGVVSFSDFLTCVRELNLAWKEEEPEVTYFASGVQILSRHYDLGPLPQAWGSYLLYDHQENRFNADVALFEWVRAFQLKTKGSVRQGLNLLAHTGVSMVGSPKFTKRDASVSPRRDAPTSPKRERKSKTPSPPRAPPKDVDISGVVFEAEGLMDSCEQGNSATVNMSEDPVAPDSLSFDVSNSAHCVGESVTSWRVYLKRMMPWKAVPIMTAGQTYRFRTGMIHQATTIGNSLVQLLTNIDAINYVAPMYVFWRGSVRYAWYTPHNANTNSSVRMGLNRTDSQMGSNEFQVIETTDINQHYNQVDNIAYAHQISSGGLEIQVPFYCKRTTGTVQVNLPADPSVNTGNPEMTISLRSNTSYASVLLRGAGDDYDLGFFLGAPITKPTFQIASANSNWNW